MSTEKGCEECDYKGWAVFNVPFPNEPDDETGGEIQRCDSCETYASDGSAIEIAILAGYDVDRETGKVLRMPPRPPVDPAPPASDADLAAAYEELGRIAFEQMTTRAGTFLLGQTGHELVEKIRTMEGDDDR